MLYFYRIFCVKAFVMVMTLTCAKVVERAHMLSQWIQIAMEVQSILGNLFAFDNIMAGLMSDQVNNFVSLFVLLLSVPSQQLWSWRDGQFTLPHFFLGKLEQAVNQYFVHILSLVTDNNPS